MMPFGELKFFPGLYVGFLCISTDISAGLFIVALLGATSNRHKAFLRAVIINHLIAKHKNIGPNEFETVPTERSVGWARTFSHFILTKG